MLYSGQAILVFSSSFWPYADAEVSDLVRRTPGTSIRTKLGPVKGSKLLHSNCAYRGSPLDHPPLIIWRRNSSAMLLSAVENDLSLQCDPFNEHDESKKLNIGKILNGFVEHDETQTTNLLAQRNAHKH